MTKHGNVEIGKTPSGISGKPCREIKEGEPIRERGELAKYVDPGLVKLARSFQDMPAVPVAIVLH